MRPARSRTLLLPLLFVTVLLPAALFGPGEARQSPPAHPAATVTTDPQLIHHRPARYLVQNSTHLFAGTRGSGETCAWDPTITHPLIWRLSLDGSAVNTLVEGCNLDLNAMVADDQHLYYIAAYDIYRIPVSGGQAALLAQLAGDGRTTLALDDDYLYWGTTGEGNVYIRRRAKIGGAIETLASLPDPLHMNVRDLLVDDSHVYWTMGTVEAGEVRRVPKTGGPVQVLANTGDGLDYPWFLSAGDSHVYWTERAAQVRRVSKSGGAVTTYTAPHPTYGEASNVAVGDTHLFWWWDGTGYGGGRISRTAKAGGPVDDLVLHVDYTRSLLLANGYVYWSQSGAGILRLPVDAPPTAIDLTIADLEVTQGLQNLDGAPVPLVAGKSTYLRAYPQADVPYVQNVGAVLRAYAPGDVPLGEIQPLNPPLVADLQAERRLLDDAFNFLLPAAWTQMPAVELCVEINADGSILEFETGNNRRCRWATFQTKAPLCVVLVPIDVSGTPFVPTPNSINGTTLELLRNMWPSPIESLGDAVMREFGGSYELPDDSARILNRLESRYFHVDFPDDWCNGGRVHMAGVVHESAETGGLLGSGRIPGSVLWYKRVSGNPPLSDSLQQFYKDRYGSNVVPISWPFAPHILAHELGHNYGRRHIDCGGPDPDTLDDGYIYSPCNFTADPPAPDAVWGFFFGSVNYMAELRNWTIVDPADQVKPLMSYSDPSWISDYTYRPIYNATPDTAFRAQTPQGAPGEMALVMLLADSESASGEIERVYRMPQALVGPQKADQLYDRHLQLLDPAGDYQVQLLDDDGAVLAAYRLQLNPDPHGDGGGLVFPFPTAPDWAALNFYGPGGLLDQQTVSPNPPSVTVLSPNGGENATGALEVTWEANDPDGDPLTFTVHYSPDGGQSWQQVASQVQGTSLTYEATDTLPGSVGNALVRVIASDGANRGWDGSDAPFSLQRKHPLPFVVTPEDGATLGHGRHLVFTGTAFDAEDGELDGDALSWQVDGQPVGSGNRVTVEGLEPGQHFLNLHATDSDGMEGEARIRFFVAGGSCPLFNNQVDLLFLFDSSSQMTDQAGATAAAEAAVDWLEGAGMDLNSASYCTMTGSCSGAVVADVHSDTAVDHPADWGAGIASLAAHYEWRQDSTRIIVPISNQAPEDGDPLHDPGADREALEAAIAAANQHGVALAPLILPRPDGQAPPLPLVALAEELATRTGGVRVSAADTLGQLLHDVKSRTGCRPRLRHVSIPRSLADHPGAIFLSGDNLWPGTRFLIGGEPAPVGPDALYGTGLSLLVPALPPDGCYDLQLSRPGAGSALYPCAVRLTQGGGSLLYLPYVARPQ